MDIKPIKNDADYRAALAVMAPLLDMDPELGTPQADTLEVLGLLVEAYEKTHHPIGLPTAIGAIQFEMEQRGLSPADMVEYLGQRSRVTEVLSGRRELSKEMMRKLHEGLGISYDALMNQPELDPATQSI